MNRTALTRGKLRSHTMSVAMTLALAPVMLVANPLQAKAAPVAKVEPANLQPASGNHCGQMTALRSPHDIGGRVTALRSPHEVGGRVTA